MGNGGGREWRTSSHSGGDNGSQCVEVAHGEARTLIRDSKAPDAGMLAVPAEGFSALVRATTSV